MLKKILKRLETKLILVSLIVILFGFIGAWFGDWQYYYGIEEVGLFLFWAGIVLLGLSFIFILFYQLFKFKNPKPLIIFLVILIITAAILFFAVPIKYTSLDETGTWCKFRGGKIEKELAGPATWISECFLKYDDGGQPCTDGDQCQGFCLATPECLAKYSQISEGTFPCSGFCQESTGQSAFRAIQNGKLIKKKSSGSPLTVY